MAKSAGRSDAERAILVLSFLVIAALIAVAVWEESLQGGGAGGNVEVDFDTGAAVTRPDGHYVPYTVTNIGSQAIAAAEFQFEVYAGDRLVDSAAVTVRLLPLQGSQDGVFVTRFDPASHDLRARMVSLQFP